MNYSDFNYQHSIGNNKMNPNECSNYQKQYESLLEEFYAQNAQLNKLQEDHRILIADYVTQKDLLTEVQKANDYFVNANCELEDDKARILDGLVDYNYNLGKNQAECVALTTRVKELTSELEDARKDRSELAKQLRSERQLSSKLLNLLID